VTKVEASSIMKAHGWFYVERHPKSEVKYVYAKRRQGQKMLDRYICPLSQLGEITEEQLVVKLVTPPAEKP
jgi:hypothetical protein